MLNSGPHHRSALKPASGRSLVGQVALQLYRFFIVAVVVWLIRDLALRQKTHGDSPILVSEIVSLLPAAVTLRPDSSERDGLFVLDRDEREIGYVVRTQPHCRDIIGYCGVTDALVVLDPNWKILGIKVHASDDTKEHVGDVVTDRRFLKKWNGMSWDTAADLNLKQAGIEGVSGATMTSMAIAQSVKARLQLSRGEIAERPALRLGWRDWGMLAVIGAASVMAFGKPAWRHRWKRPFQIALIVYVGFISGDLLAQTLFAGWARAGVPWSTAPGLVLLGAAALMVPWVSRKPLYCHHICPHGAAQELIGRFRPARFNVTLSAGVVRGLEYLPFALLLFTLVIALLCAVTLAVPLHAQTTGAGSAANEADGCPVSLTLPIGWSSAPLQNTRVDRRRNMRLRYGPGTDDVVTIGVVASDMQRMLWKSVQTNGLMAAAPPLTIAGTTAEVMRSVSDAGRQGKGGTDAWMVLLPLDNKIAATIRLTVVINSGVTPPTTEVIRALFGSMRPHACLLPGDSDPFRDR